MKASTYMLQSRVYKLLFTLVNTPRLTGVRHAEGSSQARCGYCCALELWVRYESCTASVQTFKLILTLNVQPAQEFLCASVEKPHFQELPIYPAPLRSWPVQV